MNARQRLIVVRGLTDGRERLASLLAAALPGPSVHIRGDDLARRWVLKGLPDARQEMAAVYRILRLVTISYLKEGFSAVVDAPFAAETDNGIELQTQELRDLTRLAHSFRGIDTAIVTLDTPTSRSGLLAAAIAADTIDGEVRVVPDLAHDEAEAIRALLVRLGR